MYDAVIGYNQFKELHKRMLDKRVEILETHKTENEDYALVKILATGKIIKVDKKITRNIYYVGGIR